MRYFLSKHARDRMGERDVTEAHLQEALANVVLQRDAKPGSVCIVGVTVAGRQLAIYVSGSMPPMEPLRIRTVVWRELP